MHETAVYFYKNRNQAIDRRENHRNEIFGTKYVLVYMTAKKPIRLAESNPTKHRLQIVIFTLSTIGAPHSAINISRHWLGGKLIIQLAQPFGWSIKLR